MSQITREQILKLAKLSKLRLSEDEITRYQKELSAILAYVERLDQVDVAGLEPTYQVNGLTNVFREDSVADNLIDPNNLLAVVPRTDGRYIKVNKMI